ncbi:MAG: regulatory protein SipA [Spirulinaceae cyanobacterium]
MTEPVFSVGDTVRVIQLPSYIKTAEPMPMLRPPSVVDIGEEGIIIDRRPGDYWAIRFRRGAFLLENQYIEKV